MTTTHYIWDEDNDSYFMETDGDGNVTAVYTSEPVPYGRVISQRRGNATSIYHYDGQGSTRQLTDESGNVTDEYTYAAFGETVAASGTTTNPFSYVGEYGYYADAETPTIYVRARYYHSSSGRWLSRNPVGFSSGCNLFLYAGPFPSEIGHPLTSSSPLAIVDPSGEVRVQIDPGQSFTAGACGQKKFKRWKFKLDPVERAVNECEGYIVQKVTVTCNQKDCNCAATCGGVVSGGTFTYYEAWYVKAKQNAPYRQGTYSDEAYFTPPDESCGSYRQTGAIRFYCIGDTGNLGRKNVDGDWKTKQEFGPASGCATTSAGLPGFDGKDGPPPFLAQGGGPGVTRTFQVNWECCDAKTARRKAETTFDPK